MAKQLRTSGVFNLGSLGGDSVGVGDPHWGDTVLYLKANNNSTDETGRHTPTMGTGGYSTNVPFSASSNTHSFNFNNTTAHRITLPNSTDFQFGSGEFTFEAFVRWNGTQQLGSLFNTYEGTGVRGLFFGVAGLAGGNMRLYCTSNGSSWNMANGADGGMQLTANTWHHVALVRESNGSIYSYLDGTKTTTALSTSTASIYTNGTDDAHIGGNTTNYQWMGQIDEVRITKGVARYTADFDKPTTSFHTSAPVAITRPTRKWGGLVGRSLIASDQLVKTGNLKLPELFQAKTSEPPPTHVSSNLVMHIDAGNTSSYPGTGTTVTDIEGSSRTMTLHGVTYQTANGGQFNFDGSNDYMSTSTNGLSTGKVAFSLELWVNFDQYQTTRWWLAVIGQYGAGALHLIGQQGTNSTRQYGIWSGQQIGGVIGASAGAWQQIVVTFDGTSTLKLYENNTLIGTNTSASTFNFTNDDLSIGKRTGSESFFDGKMTILRLYDRELTAAEVQNNYDVDKARHGLS